MKGLDISVSEKYKLLVNQIESLISIDEPAISNISNITAALKQTFSKFSWVGFYFVLKDDLFLGPFQGSVACSKIMFGRGVCGTAAESKSTQIVSNVHKFPGHIACDPEANSEIVIPVIQNGIVKAVLDIDSPKFSRFTQSDKEYLEQIIDIFILNTKFTDL